MITLELNKVIIIVILTAIIIFVATDKYHKHIHNLLVEARYGDPQWNHERDWRNDKYYRQLVEAAKIDGCKLRGVDPIPPITARSWHIPKVRLKIVVDEVEE